MGLFKKIQEGIIAAFTILDYIELIIIVCLGSLLLAAAIWGISKALLANGSTLYLILFSLFVFTSVSSIIRDLIHRRLGNISKIFLVCWCVCVLWAGWLWFS